VPSTIGTVASAYYVAAAPDPWGITWHSAVWAEDTGWAHPANGATVDAWFNHGTLRSAATTQTRMDATTGLYVPTNITLSAKIDHAAAMNITDFDFRCRVKLNDWTPATVARAFAEKRIQNTTAVDMSWDFAILTTGIIRMNWAYAAGGASIRTVDSTVAPTVSDGDSIWLRCVVDVDNGAGQYDVKFYQGADGVNEPGSWTQIGTTVTGSSGTTTIHQNTSPVTFGTAGTSADAAGFDGYMRRAILYTDLTASTKVFDVNFIRADTGQFVEDGPNGYTVVVRSNFDAVNLTAAQQPIYNSSTAALNNQPTVQGDGSNDRLTLLGALAFPSTVAQPYSVVVIEAGAANGKAPVDVATASAGWVFYRNTNDWWAYAGATLSAAGVADNGAHMMRFLASGASSKIAENETVVATGNAGTAAASNFSVCGSWFNFNTPQTIAFAGLYAGDITADGAWPAFKAWAAAHYGLTIA